jgi:UDP-N-acetylmuramoyl-tripeptide--D-alanyl-D-alanine ligase
VLKLTLEEVIKAIGAEAVEPLPAHLKAFPKISIDSRSIQPGEAFFAIKGQRFDGHDYLEEALRRGATVAVVAKTSRLEDSRRGCLLLRVPDTTKALQRLGSYVRQLWGRRLLAITGSMGKTTTKAFIATLLSQSFRVFQSPGNFNNEIGVPLSLLRLESHHDFAVLELGMNHPREIATLSRICTPDAAMITNVAPVHLEFFSDLDSIAEAKAEILEALGEGGEFFYNADDPKVRAIARRHRGTVLSFGFDESAQVRVANDQFSSLSEMRFEIQTPDALLAAVVPFVGKHLLYDIVAAVAVASYYGLSSEEIEAGLTQLRSLPMRGETITLGEITIRDESYNSNPTAVECLLDTLFQVKGYKRTILVLGDMLELGRESPALHYRVGQSVSRLKPERLITVGDESKMIQLGATDNGLEEARCVHFEKATQAAEFLQDLLQAGDLVVVKGSRGIRMDQLVEALREVKV